MGGPLWARPSGGLDFVLQCGLVRSPWWGGLQGRSGAAFLPSLALHPYPGWSCLAGCPSLSLPRTSFLPPLLACTPILRGVSHTDPQGLLADAFSQASDSLCQAFQPGGIPALESQPWHTPFGPPGTGAVGVRSWGGQQGAQVRQGPLIVTGTVTDN